MQITLLKMDDTRIKIVCFFLTVDIITTNMSLDGLHKPSDAHMLQLCVVMYATFAFTLLKNAIRVWREKKNKLKIDTRRWSDAKSATLNALTEHSFIKYRESTAGL